MIEIYKTYSFDSAHFLTEVPEEHPCSKLHGHTYTLRVGVKGKILSNGFVLDYLEIDKILKPIVQKLDHTLLNNLIPNPTSENILTYLLEEIHLSIPLSYVEIKETPKTGAIWRNT